jgi:hypothetical protein
MHQQANVGAISIAQRRASAELVETNITFCE